MPDESEAKHNVTRGRQAPMHTLEESLRFLRQLHQAVGTHPSGRDVLVEALGHKAGSGTGQVKIGALSHFGLLKAKRGGTYELTPLAQRILMPRNDAESREAIADAARPPTLYRELTTQLAAQQIPKLLGNLLARNYGVSAKNAESFAERFRETMEFSGLLRNGVLHDQVGALPEIEGAEVDETGSDVAIANGGKVQAESSGPRRELASNERTQEYTIPLGRDGKLAVIQVPVPLQEAYLKRLESWAAYMRSMLQDDASTKLEEVRPSQ